MKVTEKQFMQQVIDYARLNGWLVFHAHDSRRSVSGFPDLVLTRAERCVVAELKVGSNTTTANQKKWLRAFEAANVPAYTWKPEDWSEIESVLRRA